MHQPTDMIAHTTAFVTPVVDHWLEREIAHWVHPMKDRSGDSSHHERKLLPRSYISLLTTLLNTLQYNRHRVSKQGVIYSCAYRHVDMTAPTIFLYYQLQTFSEELCHGSSSDIYCVVIRQSLQFYLWVEM